MSRGFGVVSVLCAVLTAGMANPTSPQVPPSPSAPASPAITSARPQTNLTAVVDPIAVPVRGGVRVRVGVRNSGPQSINTPNGQNALVLVLFIVSSAWTGRVKSLGGCDYHLSDTSPNEDPPVVVTPASRFVCNSGPSWPAGETYWQSFVFPDLSGFDLGVWIEVSGYVEEPDLNDNRRDVEVRLASPGNSLPVTGARPVSALGVGLALIVGGAIALWYGRRRRLAQRD